MNYAKDNYSTYSLSKTTNNQFNIRYNLVLDGKALFLDFFFNNKGGTTIQTTNGKEQDVKLKIAEYISTNALCVMAGKDENNRSMTFQNISVEEYNSIIELIKEDTENCSSILSEQNSENSNITKFEGKWSDKVTIVYTKSTKRARVQGRPLLLYNVITSYFNELVDVEKVVETLEENYGYNIEKEQVENQFNVYLPNSYNKHTDKLKKSLLKAVYNLNITSQEYTCTELTFEVLRALEGHIKLTLFNDYGINSPNRFGTLEMFKFNNYTDKAYLLEPVRSIVGTSTKISYYEKAYKHLVIYRHKIFHWDYPDEFGDETIQLENSEDAKGIILTILALIDEYYIV